VLDIGGEMKLAMWCVTEAIIVGIAVWINWLWWNYNQPKGEK